MSKMATTLEKIEKKLYYCATKVEQLIKNEDFFVNTEQRDIVKRVTDDAVKTRLRYDELKRQKDFLKAENELLLKENNALKSKTKK